jgi:hypothetical protein
VLEQRDKPIEQVRREVGELLAPLGVGRENVLYRVGREKWSDTLRGDLAVLRIAADQIIRGEASADELFPAPPVAKVAYVPEAGAKPITEHAVDTAEQVVETLTAPPKKKLTTRTRGALKKLCVAAGLDPDKDMPRMLRLFEILGAPEEPLTDPDHLTDEEGKVIAAWLEAQGNRVADEVAKILHEDDEARAADAAAEEMTETMPPEPTAE